MQSAVCTLTSVVNATKETDMAHTLGAMMGRDDSSERPMLLRYCDSRRIVVPKVEVWFGFEGENVILFQMCGSDGASPSSRLGRL